MKILAAVFATALITTGGSIAAGVLTISPGQGLHVASTSMVCVGYRSVSGNGIVCSKAGSHIYVNVYPAGVGITKGKPLGDVTSSNFATFVRSGGVVSFTNWAGQSSDIASVADAQTIASLQGQVSTLQAQLTSAKAVVAAAQSSAVGAIESAGLASLMNTTLPQLGAWVNGQGGSFRQTTDTGIGFADYGFECDSCYTG